MKPTCTSPLAGVAYRGSDGAVTCCLCDCEMEWHDCQECAGDGGFDGYEDDPNWYQPGEMVNCHMCGGQGGEYWCESPDCQTITAIKILKTKPDQPAAERLIAQPNATQRKEQ